MPSPITFRSRPAIIVSDDCTELTSMAMLRWSQKRQVEWFSRQATAVCLRRKFQSSLRDALLNETLFGSVAHVR